MIMVEVLTLFPESRDLAYTPHLEILLWSRLMPQIPSLLVLFQMDLTKVSVEASL